MWIFDRLQPSHPWQHLLEELSVSDDVTHQAVALNWSMDHRVSLAREQELLIDSGFSRAQAGAEWLAEAASYFRRRVCRPYDAPLGQRSPYAEPSNDPNLLRRAVPAFDQLLHVASFNRMMGRLARPGVTTDDQRQEFESLTGASFPSALPSDRDTVYWPAFSARMTELARHLQQLGAETIRIVARFLCDASGDAQPPWWATFAEELRDELSSGDGGVLARALGLGYVRSGEYLLVWRYEVGELARLYRPTVIEASDSPFHFPSPPETAWGITMPLDSSAPASREVIHPPLRGNLAARACTGELYRIGDSREVYSLLGSLRDAHWERLKGEFREVFSQEWLARHSADRR